MLEPGERLARPARDGKDFGKYAKEADARQTMTLEWQASPLRYLGRRLWRFLNTPIGRRKPEPFTGCAECRQPLKDGMVLSVQEGGRLVCRVCKPEIGKISSEKLDEILRTVKELDANRTDAVHGYDPRSLEVYEDDVSSKHIGQQKPGATWDVEDLTQGGSLTWIPPMAASSYAVVSSGFVGMSRAFVRVADAAKKIFGPTDQGTG